MAELVHLDPTDLQDEITKVFGTEYVVANVTKVHGGAQKVVYKVTCFNGFTCILYVWDLSMNYFQEEIESDDIHSQSYGSHLFEMNNEYLRKLGVKTPTLYSLRKERIRYPFDYAFVEYMDGHPAETYFHHGDSEAQDVVFGRLGEMLRTMHGTEKQIYGGFGQQASETSGCHVELLKNAEKQLAYAAESIDRIKENQGELLAALYELESRIRPRNRYGFIHGELGPDHVLVSQDLQPYLIDIEGARFFDIEHEHSFLALRFGDYYRYLNNDRLDRDRLRFYRFHHHLSLTAGGLKLLHRGFPDQRFAKELAVHHSRSALRFIGAHDE